VESWSLVAMVVQMATCDLVVLRDWHCETGKIVLFWKSGDAGMLLVGDVANCRFWGVWRFLGY